MAASARLVGAPPLPLFLETPTPPKQELPPLSKQSLLLFLKLYDAPTQTLKVWAPPPLLRADARNVVLRPPPAPSLSLGRDHLLPRPLVCQEQLLRLARSVFRNF